MSQMIHKVKSHSIILTGEVDDRFRDNIGKRTPHYKGDRKQCGDEAITMWNEWIEAAPDKEKMQAWAQKWTQMIKA